MEEECVASELWKEREREKDAETKQVERIGGAEEVANRGHMFDSSGGSALCTRTRFSVLQTPGLL